jgi:toxin-antitoxin system PIN domain toxin
MIAVDTNILVYAHREDSPWHDTAYANIVELAEGRSPWAIPWPCIHEFLAITTHPKIFSPPTPLSAAVDQVEALMESPSLVLLLESEGYWPQFREIIEAGRVAGGQIHDARIAALCELHGVKELWTADRDFTRFPSLSVRNPLII